MQLHDAEFSLVLAQRICSLIVDPEAWARDSENDDAMTVKMGAKSLDPSYTACLARWVKWIVDEFASSNEDMKKEIIIQFLRDLGRVLPQPKKSR